jgi:plastocyanin
LSKLRLITAALLAASLAVGTSIAFAGTKTVKIGDNWFKKDTESTQTVKINVGSRIKWKWVGSDEHDVRLHSAPSGVKKSNFKAGERSEGTKRTRKFTVPGTYKFYCSIHDDKWGEGGYDAQRLTVKVKS